MVMEPGGGNMALLAQAWKNSEKEGSNFFISVTKSSSGYCDLCSQKGEKKNRHSLVSLPNPLSPHTSVEPYVKCWGVSDLVLEENRSIWGQRNVNMEPQV